MQLPGDPLLAPGVTLADLDPVAHCAYCESPLTEDDVQAALDPEVLVCRRCAYLTEAMRGQRCCECGAPDVLYRQSNAGWCADCVPVDLLDGPNINEDDPRLDR